MTALPVCAAEISGGQSAESQAGPDEARAQKSAGDILVKEDAYEAAAGHYLKALALPNDFSGAVKTQMAVYISWAGDLGSAIRVLREVLESDRDNLKARLHLARVLSWDGRLDEAISDADAVLGKDPGNRDALLIMANALRWKGNSAESLKIYERLLAEREDFDARTGYAFALLNEGQIKKSKESFEKLVPAYPAQERDYKALKSELERAELETRPVLNAGFSYYNDTDSNQVRRYTLGAGFPVSGKRGEFRYAHIDAEDNGRDKNAESFSVLLSGRLIGGVTGRANIGGVFKGNGGFLTGGAGMEGNLLDWSVSAGFSRDMLTDTAQLIENGVRYTDYSVSAARPFGRTRLNASLSHRRFSDDNYANDFSVGPRYTLVPGSLRVDVGYKFRYLDFDRQSGSGYFDPDQFFSHQLLLTVYYEKENFYAYMEPYYGRQSFDRNGVSSDDEFEGGSALAGYKVGRGAIEVSGERGNYAVGSATGFEYYMVGLTVRYTP